jgi:hypothetical protein
LRITYPDFFHPGFCGIRIRIRNTAFFSCLHCIIYYRKEREFEETMDSLQNDIDSLESERGELKDKVKQMSKKVLIQGLTKSHSISDGRIHTTSVADP